MVHVSYGTQAELIKLAPIIRELARRAAAHRVVFTGQHPKSTAWLLDEFGLHAPDVTLRQADHNITRISAGLGWLAKHYIKSMLCKRWLRRKVFPGGGICLVHGDTASTYLGMTMARRAGLDIGHVESGLRSFKLWSPFPEEIIRIRCAKRSRMLFPPSDRATDNLRAMRVKGQVVPTDGNTAVDALKIALSHTPTVDIPNEPFALAAIHRLETITNRRKFERVLRIIRSAADRLPVVFVLYPPTKEYLTKLKLAEMLAHDNIRTCPMLPHYYDFIAMVRAAACLLADGCSLQEECALLNKPYLILRNETERSDGLGANAMLWQSDDRVAAEFLDRYQQLGGEPLAPWPSPSMQIVDALAEAGYC